MQAAHHQLAYGTAAIPQLGPPRGCFRMKHNGGRDKLPHRSSSSKSLLDFFQCLPDAALHM